MDIQLSLIIESKIYRESITHYLNSENGISVTHSFNCASQTIRSIDHCDSDIVVIDGSIKDALLLVNTIKDTHIHMNIILLINAFDVSFPGKCIALGAEGIVTNSDGLGDLKACIETVHSGHLSYPREMSNLFQGKVSRLARSERLIAGERPVLTRRQSIVMQLIASGLSNKEIARKLNIELSTVKNHVHQILERLQVKSRLEASAQFRVSQSSSQLLI